MPLFAEAQSTNLRIATYSKGALMILFLLACITDKDMEPEYAGLAVLGYEDNEDEEVLWTLIGDSSDGLNIPRDLGFNPDRPGELWVVNRADDSVTRFFDAASSSQHSDHVIDPYAFHFMEEVSSIEFGATGTFGTCQESRNTYNDQGFPNDFMGPTLWSSELDVFGESNPEAVEYLSDLYDMHTDLGSHLDMLHESPLCMGIAWQFENIYWVFNGKVGSIDRNNFHKDHGIGFDDHSDGSIFRYGAGEFERLPDIPSHMKFDHSTQFLYIADTGNNAIKILDTQTGEADTRQAVKEPGTEHYAMKNEAIWTLIDGSDYGMEAPSGLTIVDDTLLITDNKTSTIYAFTTDGDFLDLLETPFPEGALMGIYAASIDDLWMVNALDDEVWRLQSSAADPTATPSIDEYTTFFD